MNKCFGVDSDTRTHSAGHADTFQVGTFCRRGFRLDDRIEQLLAVLSNFFRGETHTSDRSMNDTYFIHFESDFTAFNIVDGVGHIVGNCA